MRLDERYPNLEQFFGHFHQDWDHDYVTADDGIRAYLTNSRARIAGTAEELKTFLSEMKDDTKLRKAIIELGNNYEPNNDGLTDRQWLSKQVLPMLEKHLAEHKGRIVKSV